MCSAKCKSNGLFSDTLLVAYRNIYKGQNTYFEASDRSNSEDISEPLHSPNVNYRPHKSPTHLLMLNNMNSVHALHPFLKMYFNIILLFSRVCPTRSLPFSVSD
jgi:hypothetical protein